MTDETVSDVLYGLAAIAAHLGMTPRQGKHRVASGSVPTFKMDKGRTICARRTALNAWLAEQESKARKISADAKA